MTKVTKTATKKKSSPAKVARLKRVRREEERRNLWVVTSSRMKMYGDVKIQGMGQIIKRQFLPNDGKILEIGYARPVEESEDFETCDGCGTRWLGTNLSGPYLGHQRRARHNEAVEDLDNPGLSRPAPSPNQRNEADADPTAEKDGQWDLEEEGAPTPTRIEDDLGIKGDKDVAKVSLRG